MQNNNGSRVIPTTVFLLYRKLLVSYKVKNAPRGCASRGEEVSCKQHRSSAKESQATLCSIIGHFSLSITQKGLRECFLIVLRLFTEF